MFLYKCIKVHWRPPSNDCYIMQGVYYNASFVNLQLHNYLFAVSCYCEAVEE